jgi:hypothetical protein
MFFLPCALAALVTAVVLANMAMLKQMSTDIAAVRSDMGEVRAEMAEGFSAVRAEMAEGFSAVRTEMAAGFSAVRAEMAEGFSAVRTEMAEGFGAQANFERARIALAQNISCKYFPSGCADVPP